MKSEASKKIFYTPEHYAVEQGKIMHSSRGPLLFASCTSGAYLAARVVRRYEELLREAGSHDSVLYLENIDKRFSDTETSVRLEHHVNGYDVYLFQSLYHPHSVLGTDQHYMAFFIAARALREHGAKQITGILPYLAYGRQDKPTVFKREPVTAKLMADLSITAGIDRLIVWAPHCGQLHGFYGSTPVDFLDPLSLFLEEFEEHRGRDDVIAVAPDIGASKFVTYFGRALNVNVAIASKYRPEAERVVISEIIGDFKKKKTALILDDMISNGGTVYALTKKLVKEKGIERVLIGVSHNLCVGNACDLLIELHENYSLSQVVITNSIPQTEEFLSQSFVKVKCLSDSLARTINRIHYNKSVSEVFTTSSS